MLISLEADVDLDTRLLGCGTGLFFLVSSVDDEDKVTLSLGLGIGSINIKKMFSRHCNWDKQVRITEYWTCRPMYDVQGNFQTNFPLDIS